MSLKIESNLTAVLQEVDSRTQSALGEVRPVILSTARRIVAHKTGKLKRSIEARLEAGKLTLGSDVDYAAHIEEQQPYLRPALMQTLRFIKKVFKAKP